MKIKSEELDGFLRELTLSSEFRMLDVASDKDELIQIAKKGNLAWPSPDIAIFKSKYAFTDKKNLNGCRLPKEEVAKSLGTLTHKPIDIDHLRKSVIGHYLYAELIDDTVYAYGALYKDNFKEEFSEIQDLMNQGTLKTSFEAFGNREPYDSASYDLTDIVWAGGGLLVDTTPAFPNASVVEMASKRVLELAKVMQPPVSFIRGATVKTEEDVTKEKQKAYLEKAGFNVNDFEMFMRMMSQVQCPSCNEGYSQNVSAIDFKNGIIKSDCYMCDNEVMTDITPKSDISLENCMKVISSKVVIKKDIETKIDAKSSINSEEQIKMEEKIKQLEAEIAKLAEQVKTKDTEIATLSAQVSETKSQVEAATATVESLKVEKDTAVKQAKETATLVANRRAELGSDFAKDLSDEDIADELKFKVAKLEKENAELKVKVTAKPAPVTTASTETSLTVGSKETVDIVTPEVTARQNTVRKLAFGE